MKRIRCPKCDESILFDETQYEPGRVLVFECPECHKQFKIRIPQPKPAATTEDEDDAEQTPVLGKLVVLENAFHFKQEIPLYPGENVVGRLVKGSNANAAIKTVDPSMDTTHCIILPSCCPTALHASHCAMRHQTPALSCKTKFWVTATVLLSVMAISLPLGPQQ